MKKLMFAAVIMAAGAAMAVESGVVGYHHKAIASGFNYFCNTFVPCGGTKTALKLGDIKVDTSKFKGSSIDFLTPGGANAFIDDPDLGYVQESYVYWPANLSDCGEEGWFLMDDYDAEYPRNNRPLKLGEAYCVSCAGAEEIGANLIYSGVVEKESMPLTIGAGFNYMGNCAPATKKLGDITVDTSKFKGSSIDFLTSGGANAFITDPDIGYVQESYVYWPANLSDCGEAGWFLMDDYDAEYPRNDRVLEASDAFCVSCAGAEEVGATITLPSAL